MAQYKQSIPRKVEYARNALVSLVHDRNLQAGDRLPSYAVLRDTLGIGSQTIADAVDLLCQAGILEVRDKIGIFVQNPNGSLLAGRTIAVVVRQLEGSAYAATLAGFIQRYLNEHNCQCLTFFRRANATGEHPQIEEFPGLAQSLTEHRCDGVLTLCPFAESSLEYISSLGIPCCFIGDDDQNFSHSGVVLEVKKFLKEAQVSLKEKGCQNIMQIAVTGQQLNVRRSSGLPGLIGMSYGGGAQIAKKLLAMPQQERPDGLVSDDDTVVSGLLAELLQSQYPAINYMPWIATIVHRELGERYPTDRVLLFEQSIGEYAQLAVDLLMNQLRNGKSKKERIMYGFKPLNNQQTTINNSRRESHV